MDARIRIPVACLILLLAGFCGFCVVKQKLRKKAAEVEEANKLSTSISRVANHLLSLVAKECVDAGSWRVTLLEETVYPSGEARLSRVWRIAEQPQFSGGGTDEFPLRRSVLRGMQSLELNDVTAPPVDLRVNFPDRDTNETSWRKDQEQFVGDRAGRLRMPSRAYGWRRIAPSEPGQSLYVLLIETTNPRGIVRAGLDNVLLDSIARALILALR